VKIWTKVKCHVFYDPPCITNAQRTHKDSSRPVRLPCASCAAQRAEILNVPRPNYPGCLQPNSQQIFLSFLTINITGTDNRVSSLTSLWVTQPNLAKAKRPQSPFKTIFGDADVHFLSNVPCSLQCKTTDMRLVHQLCSACLLVLMWWSLSHLQHHWLGDKI